MRPVRVSVSSLSTSSPIPVNWRSAKIGLFCALSSGAAMTYTVEHTPDDPNNFTDASDFNANGSWFATDGITGCTSSCESNLDFSVRAVRLNVTSYTSGTATLDIIQQG